MTTARQRLVPLDDREEWDRTLTSVPHAFAHTWASCRAMHLTTGWPTFLHVWEDGPARFVCAIAERGEPGRVDVVTPYGFGGFTGRGSAAGLLEDWVGLARERGYLCGYLGLNPELVPAVCRESADYAEHTDVYVLDLAGGVDVLLRALPAKRRGQLRAATAGGVRVIDDHDRLGDFFLAHVRGFLDERGATSTYAFTDATWGALLETPSVFLWGAETPDGEIVAVSVFANTPHCGEYLFAVSRPGGTRYSAPLVWAGARTLASLGVTRFNLGGGVRRGDGIAAFKERFGGARLPLGALRQVYRPDAYAALCREARRDPDSRTGFFPPYRAPDVSEPSGHLVDVRLDQE